MKAIWKMEKTVAALLVAPVLATAAERPWANAEELADFHGYHGATMTNNAAGYRTKRFWANEEHTVWRDANYDERAVRPYSLEDPLVFADGRKVETVADWRERRAEMLSIFESEVYGRLPPRPDHMVADLVKEEFTEDRFSIRRTYRQYFRADRTGPVIDWLVIVPRFAKGRVPVILHLNYKGNDLVSSGRTNHYTLPLEHIAARGYAFMSAHYTQITADPKTRDEWDERAYDGVFELWGPRDPSRTDNPGAIMAWAWGLMRGLDLAETVKEIDATRSVVIGSSRIGKAALLAGAFDERFKVVIPNQTGAAGVQLLKRDFGENPAVQHLMFSHWYCRAYWKYENDPAALQHFDQHMLLACVAPRALLLECFESPWFDPKGEFASAIAASPVWEKFAGKGLGCAKMPDRFCADFARPPLGYVIRGENHGLSGHDWMWALDFADRALAERPDASRIETERVYLSGRGCDDAVDWSFEIDSGARAGEKTTVPVPGCWEAHGFGVLQYGNYLKGPDKKYRTVEPERCTGVYRRRFAAPEGGDGRHVDLVFQAVFTDCEVSLNGERLGSHQGGFYPFQFDVTGKLRAENELVVTVKSESSDESVNLAERRGDYWNYGGIWRPVYLEIKPLRHIRRVAVDAKADGTLDAVVYASDGTTQKIHEKWDRPRLWTAETPNLYDKAFELRDDEGRVVHRVVKKIGFRTVEARRGDCLRINGRRVTIKGVNRHSFRPDSGRTLSYARNREDVELIKSMNMNAVRSSHYPPDAEFLDLCDELGLYVVDELCGWQQAIGTKPGAPLVEAFVTRDQAHPSVIWWANGNEGGFNFELDGLYHVFDVQKRPVIHPWDEFGAFHTKHYRNYEQTKEFLAGDWIFMPTEFQHGLYDGGHAAGLGELWELMMSSPRTAGGFLWDLRDQGVLRPDGSYDCHGTNGPDGIVGPNGEKGGSFDAIREIWSPVGISLANDGRSVVFTNRYDFIDLAECRFRWESLGFGGDRETVLAGGMFDAVSAEPRGCSVAAFPRSALGGDAVRVTATGPHGETVFAKVFALRCGVSEGTGPSGRTCESVSWQPRLVAMKGTESHRHQRFLPVAADFSWTAVTNLDSSVEYSWTINTTNAVDLLGVSFDLDESQVVSKKWLGRGPYRVWRNRPEGPQLGIWENAYNDGYAGESWNFPQFKGYFADTRWMSFEMKDGFVVRFDLLEKSPYVGAFSPNDGRDEFLFQPPKLGVSVLAVCPAVGNKFTSPKDVSPSGRSVVPTGAVTGRVRVSLIPPPVR